MYYLSERITIDEQICNGKPTIRGIGITVKTVLEFLFAGDSPEEILHQYPDLEAKDIEACQQYALELADHPHSIRPIAA
jgi:uncharacterized protein (DUF433 family)